MIYILLVLALVALDGVIKYNVEKKLDSHKRTYYLNGKVYLTKFHNKGLALSKGKNNPELVKWMSFLITVVCFCVFLITLGQKGSEPLKASLAILMGGAISNTTDRLTRGYVVDYLGFKVKNKRLRNVIYNASDFFLLIGATLTILGAFLDRN